MKSLLVMLLLSALSIPVLAKKDPAVEQRRQFIEDYAKALEQAGVWGWQIGPVTKWGKTTKFSIALRGSVATCIQWEKDNVEPVRAKAKELGFIEIELLMPETQNSATFPDGKWKINLAEDPKTGYRGVHSQ